MTDKPENSESEDSAGELRNKLIQRLAVAGVMVALLLGVLAFFDYLSTPQEEPDEPVFTSPVPVAPKKPLSQPVTTSTELPEPPAPAAVVAEAPPPPQVAVPPAVVEAAKPEVAKPDVPKPAPVQENRPAQPSTAGAAKPPASVPAPTPVPSVQKPLRPVPESTAAPSQVPLAPVQAPATLAPNPKPTARIVETRQMPVEAPSGAARLFSGFLLQAGVFASPQRAEELHAKLTLSGVPSTLETRVQVGPFRTRQEAELAQAKLKELGVETVLVPPRAGKH
ncbi:SPOR domain-containing protein [Quatrionicoccus australiensis]|uniref:SPOR domain-containing protein n=1 Tax=Quatrionicoccus australiensis TaxID=138118 RepID=UPI001CFAE349|nr:SPOR domain-containing protein [Quatrionicoccus australiensis]MCB4360388.1 SPOR domain-containing protein [Quatrionicoccus australiensis]